MGYGELYRTGTLRRLSMDLYEEEGVMTIRIRRIDEQGHLVALCAAETEAEKGDLYLNDTVHQALSEKYWKDWKMDKCKKHWKEQP